MTPMVDRTESERLKSAVCALASSLLGLSSKRVALRAAPCTALDWAYADDGGEADLPGRMESDHD